MRADAGEKRLLLTQTCRGSVASRGPWSILGGAVILGFFLNWQQGFGALLAWARGADLTLTFGEALGSAGVLLGAGQITFGLWDLATNWSYLKRRWGLGATKRSSTESPWEQDHPWDRQAAHDPGGARIGRSLAYALLGALVLLPANAFMLESPWRGEFYLLVLPDLVLGLYLVRLAYQFLRWLKYGSARLEFAAFPFYLGETLEGTLVLDSPIEAEQLTCTLRCIQEEIVRTHQGRGTFHRSNQSAGPVAYELLALPSQVPLPTPTPGAEEVRVPLSLPIPSSPGLETDLANSTPRYWELLVDAETPGVDFHASFLVPIYWSSRNPASEPSPDTVEVGDVDVQDRLRGL